MGRNQDAGDAGPHLQVGAALWPLRPPSLLAPRGAHSVHTHCVRGPRPADSTEAEPAGVRGVFPLSALRADPHRGGPVRPCPYVSVCLTGIL